MELQELVWHLEIPKSRHGRVVGPEGSKVSRISAMFGVQIVVPKRSDPTEVVLLRGVDERSMALAKEAMEQECGVRAGDPTMDPLLRVHVEVAQERRGAIIGPGGAVRRAIEEECGVLLHIPSRDDSEPSVFVEGVATACAQARSRLESLLTPSPASTSSSSFLSTVPLPVRVPTPPAAAQPQAPLVEQLLAKVTRARQAGYVAAAKSMPDRAAMNTAVAQMLASGSSEQSIKSEFRSFLVTAKQQHGREAVVQVAPGITISGDNDGDDYDDDDDDDDEEKEQQQQSQQQQQQRKSNGVQNGGSMPVPVPPPVAPSVIPAPTFSRPPRTAPAATASTPPPAAAIVPYPFLDYPNPGLTVVLDGANVAMAHGQGIRRSAGGIVLASRYFISLDGVGRVVAFVPQHWGNVEELRYMMPQGAVVATCPSQADDDVFFLEYARNLGFDGFIVTNDMFRDHIISSQARRIDHDSGRVDLDLWCRSQLVPYTFVDNDFIPYTDAAIFDRLAEKRGRMEF